MSFFRNMRHCFHTPEIGDTYERLCIWTGRPFGSFYKVTAISDSGKCITLRAKIHELHVGPPVYETLDFLVEDYLYLPEKHTT